MKTKTSQSRSLDNMIFMIRGQRVMLDRDLATLYEVPTYRLNEAVKRHINRLPDDFMFQLTKEELIELIANCDRFNTLKHSSSFPYAFTEHGVAMLASVLKFSEHKMVIKDIVSALNRLMDSPKPKRKIGFSTDK